MATDPRLARGPARIATPPQPPPPPPPPEALTQQRPSVGLDGADDGSTNGIRPEEGGFKLRFCTVCASNQNRCVDDIPLESVRWHNISVCDLGLLSQCRVAVIPESNSLLKLMPVKLLARGFTIYQESYVHRLYLNHLQSWSHPSKPS